jgi:hypothetical protein
MDATGTAEPDDFARLLAQLNGTDEPERVEAAPVAPAPAYAPAAQIPPAPAFTLPPAPETPAPEMPAPVMSAPAMPAPVAQLPVMQTPVAPAFGLATPYPANASALPSFSAGPGNQAPLSFPDVAPLPDPVAPVATPLPRAPELMGADELAAPPRSFPPLSEPVPPLVSPPEYGIQSAPAPTAPALFAAESAAPVAPFTPASFTPAPAAPPSPPASSAPSSPPSAVRAPLDFASLLTTPVDADDGSSAAAAPLRFGSGSSNDDDEPDLGRPTTGEKIGLVLAVLVAPIGLIAGIVAAARSAQRRGWVVEIVRASIAIATVLTIALGIGGYFGYLQLKQQQAHDQIAASSAAFCATIKANPDMDQLPTFGWPGVAASIPDSLKAMQAYEDRWTKLAKVSPPGIKPGVTRVAAAAKKIIDGVTVSRIVDDASNVALMSSVASSSGVPEWHSEYCG